MSEAAAGAGGRVRRRQLLLQDGLHFLVLTLVVVALSGFTTLLFRSFEARREGLAERWAARGRAAMAQGRSAEAVSALRVALSYRQDDVENQMALADALAKAGRNNEAESWYSNLWQARPGDGPINLRLARLERQRGHTQQATDYYRAAIFGTWSGDAPERRRETRLELAEYLLEMGQKPSALVELTLVAGNNPDAATQLKSGELMASAGDAKDAYAAFRNAETGTDAPVAAARAGELCYSVGDYDCAAEELKKALTSKRWTAAQREHMGTLQANATRVQALDVSQALPAAIRAVHLLADAAIARGRLKNCPDAEDESRWKTLDTAEKRRALRHDDDLQAEYAAAIQDTEAAAVQRCGAPEGDDALLLLLHDHPSRRIGEAQR